MTLHKYFLEGFDMFRGKWIGSYVVAPDADTARRMFRQRWHGRYRFQLVTCLLVREETTSEVSDGR